MLLVQWLTVVVHPIIGINVQLELDQLDTQRGYNCSNVENCINTLEQLYIYYTKTSTVELCKCTNLSNVTYSTIYICSIMFSFCNWIYTPGIHNWIHSVHAIRYTMYLKCEPLYCAIGHRLTLAASREAFFCIYR